TWSPTSTTCCRWARSSPSSPAGTIGSRRCRATCTTRRSASCTSGSPSSAPTCCSSRSTSWGWRACRGASWTTRTPSRSGTMCPRSAPTSPPRPPSFSCSACSTPTSSPAYGRQTIRGAPVPPRWSGPCPRRRPSTPTTSCRSSRRRRTTRREPGVPPQGWAWTVMAELGARTESLERALDSGRLAGGSVGDFIALMKPRVMALVVFTALVGMVIAPPGQHPALAVIALICIAAGAGASGALNMWYDADIDALMQRTAARPIPRGHVTPDEALAFGVVLAAGSVFVLGVLVNWTAGALLALTIGFYLFVYTMWLKRRTPQNIVIGGAAGSFPPMIGWAAMTGSVSMEGLVLFLMIFLWTPPHFWALALYRARDYERARVPMLPVVAGPDETRKQIVIYAALLVPLALAPSFMGLGGPFYTLSAIVLGAI